MAPKQTEENSAAENENLASILPRMQRFASALTVSRGQANVLVQQAYARLLRKPEASDNVGPLDSWMYRLIHNAWMDQKRGAPTTISDLPDTVPVSKILPENREDALVHNPVLARMRLELSHLPVEQRTVLMLVCVDGLSYHEAAGILGIPVGTLTTRLCQGRLALADRLRQPDSAGRA